MSDGRIYEPRDPAEVLDWTLQHIRDQQPFHTRVKNRSVDGLATLVTTDLQAEHFFEPDDMVIGVEAGVPWTQLQNRLASHGMHIPVWPWFGHDTVGSMVAGNRYGAERMERGGIRDWIIGIAYINGMGKAVKAGGQVVKNVTGYDVAKLMVGSQGGFGPITSVNFKMMPLPIAPQGLYGTLRSAHWMTWVKEDVLARRLPLDWFEARYHDEAWHIGLGISGNQPRAARLIDAMLQAFDNQLCLAPDGGEPDIYEDFSPERRRGGFLSTLLPEDGKPRFHLHGTAPTDALLSRSRLQEALTAMPGTVVLHPIGGDFHIVGPLDVLTETHTDNLRRAMSGTGGYLMQERSRPDLLSAFGACIPLPSEYSLMQRMKRTLDPTGIFHAPFYEMV